VSPAIELTPQQATAQLLDLSATERGIFRTCRRRWKLTTLDSLTTRVPNWNFAFGTGIHAALEAYYNTTAKTRKSPAAHEALETWYTQEHDRSIKEELEDLPGADEFLNELYELAELGHTMIENYPKWERDTRVDLGKILAVEGNLKRGSGLKPTPLYPGAPVEIRMGRALCPIVDPDSKEPIVGADGEVLDYGGPFLTGRLDLLTERKTPKKGLWIVDHKTDGGRTYTDDGLDYDDQITAYCYVVWRWLGVIPRGVVLNILVKQGPKPPRVVSNGEKLSYAKDQLTTPDAYLDACLEFGHMQRSGGSILSENHEACYEALKARGWDPFYRRFEAMRSETELINFEARLYQEYMDMGMALTEGDLYPNFSPWNCPRCPVKRLCRAMEDGSDAEGTREQEYRVERDRKAAGG
jgi:hypothetical protein